MLWLESGGIFAVGNARYSLFPPDDPKLGLWVEIDEVLVLAVVDTGSPYLVCSLELAAQMNVSGMDKIGTAALWAHSGKIRGDLYRLPVKFLAAEGTSVEIVATAVVPHPNQSAWHNAPTFLGFRDCLERLRFAIDPSEEKFYFGPHP